jgi:hypothetical protein
MFSFPKHARLHLQVMDVNVVRAVAEKTIFRLGLPFVIFESLRTLALDYKAGNIIWA